MVMFLQVVALLLALGSWAFVSNATAGVAGICFACFLVLLARMSQAEHHHQALVMRLGASTVGDGPAPRVVGPSERARAATTEGVLGALGGR